MEVPIKMETRWYLVIATVIAVLAAGHAIAGDDNIKKPAREWPAVDAARLAEMRGGFVTPSGLILSLGIERSVAINGITVSQSSLHISDVRAIGSAEALALKNALQPGALQRGADGLLTSSAGQLAGGTIVQNALNDQAIATRTVISTTVNSGSLLKEINFMSSVRDANIGAMAPKN